MAGWEYCAVKGIRGLDIGKRDLQTYNPAVWCFTSEGVETVEIKGREAAEVGRTIAQLGHEGWEMVGCGNLYADTHVVYFKRLKP
jgi:hypothetical protein